MPNKPSKKVAFVASVYRHLEAFHLPFMKLFQEQGYEVHAYANADRGKNGVVAVGVICHDLNFQRSPFKPGNLKVMFQLVECFKKEQFDMVHLHTPAASIFGRIAASIAGISPVIYTAHGFHFFKGAPLLYWLLFYPIERLMARWTDYIVTINQEDFLKAKSFPVRKEVVYVPGVGLELEKFRFSDEEKVKNLKRSELGINEKEFVVMCIAELIPRKNQIQLLKAVYQLIKAQKPIRCFLVGGGRDEQYLKSFVEKLRLEEYVQILGFRRDIAELIVASDAVALLSKQEGLPRVLMEAMAIGRPIVTTDVRGNRDLVIDGKTGFVVPLVDEEKTAQALMKLIDDSELRITMGCRNKAEATKYDISQIIDYMSKIYAQAMGWQNLSH